MNRIIWAPSADANIASYDVETAASLAGPWALLANVLHDLEGGAYDAAEAVFFQNHDGAITAWYRVTAIDSNDQRSAPSTPFQALSMGALALASLADLKAYLSIKTAADDALLARLLLVASTFFESQVGRPLGLASYTEVQSGNGGRILVPKNYPVAEVASVTIEGETVPEAADATAAGWVAVEDLIHLRGYSATEGIGNVTLSYTAGYASVPPDVQQAVLELAALKYRERPHIGTSSQSVGGQSVSFLPSIIPASVQAVINTYKRVSF